MLLLKDAKMYPSIFYTKKLHDPDALDYMLRTARGEFSFFACEAFEKNIQRIFSFFNRHPEMREKAN